MHGSGPSHYCIKGGRTQQRAPAVDPDINLFPANTPPFDNTRAETIAQQQQKYNLRSCGVLIQLLVVSYSFIVILHTSSELTRQGVPGCLSSSSRSPDSAHLNSAHLNSAHLNSSGWIHQARFLRSEDFPRCADLIPSPLAISNELLSLLTLLLLFY